MVLAVWRLEASTTDMAPLYVLSLKWRTGGNFNTGLQIKTDRVYIAIDFTHVIFLPIFYF